MRLGPHPQALPLRASRSAAAEGSPAGASRRAVREVFEPRVFLDERELRGSHRPVALLADDDFGRAFGLLVRAAVGVAILLLAKNEHDDVRVLFERARLTQVGQLRAV